MDEKLSNISRRTTGEMDKKLAERQKRYRERKKAREKSITVLYEDAMRRIALLTAELKRKDEEIEKLEAEIDNMLSAV